MYNGNVVTMGNYSDINRPYRIIISHIFSSNILSDMPITEVEEILSKYKKQEEDIETKLRRNNVSAINLRPSNDILIDSKTLYEAKLRNRNILKDLEIVKANLRSKAIFSPSEMQWKKICENYKSEPALVVSKWRCHVPIYV